MNEKKTNHPVTKTDQQPLLNEFLIILWQTFGHTKKIQK